MFANNSIAIHCYISHISLHNQDAKSYDKQQRFLTSRQPDQISFPLDFDLPPFGLIGGLWENDKELKLAIELIYNRLCR